MKKILFALLAATMLIGCQEKKDDNVIKIGAILPLTGSLSEMGKVEQNAMLLAADHLLRDSSETIELIFEDNQSNSALATAAANKLLTMDNVDIVISSTTGASLAIQPIIDRYNVPHVAFCMDTGISSLSKNTIRYYMGLEQEINAILNYIDKTTTENIGVLCCKIPAYETLVNKYIKPHFTDSQNTLKYIDYYDLNQIDFRSVALQIKQENLDKLILLGYGFEYHNIYKQFVEQNILGDFQILGGWGFLYTNLDMQLLEGTLVAGPNYVFGTNKLIEEFKQSYFNKNASYPNFDAAFAYELVLNIPSLLKMGSDIKNNIASKKVKSSIVGGYSFDNNGNMLLEKVGMGVYKSGSIDNL